MILKTKVRYVCLTDEQSRVIQALCSLCSKSDYQSNTGKVTVQGGREMSKIQSLLSRGASFREAEKETNTPFAT